MKARQLEWNKKRDPNRWRGESVPPLGAIAAAAAAAAVAAAVAVAVAAPFVVAAAATGLE